ncbi:hypothetical protein KUTeg_021224 [Tegillarca granosa]|uniref:Uncharacterized protein n=1 Tax=Tegillarca granosa TaxID=220873 RepID=A0ABQ9EEA0_TEGGR|nr:hypothetical protein KUTeg_021224 [Tegillarca granosa]
MSDEVRTMLRKADFYRSVDYNCLYFTVHEAVVIAQELQAIRKLEDELSIENEAKQKEEQANPNIPLPMNFEPLRFENIEFHFKFRSYLIIDLNIPLCCCTISLFNDLSSFKANSFSNEQRGNFDTKERNNIKK